MKKVIIMMLMSIVILTGCASNQEYYATLEKVQPPTGENAKFSLRLKTSKGIILTTSSDFKWGVVDEGSVVVYTMGFGFKGPQFLRIHEYADQPNYAEDEWPRIIKKKED